jgi:hypothetical protein
MVWTVLEEFQANNRSKLTPWLGPEVGLILDRIYVLRTRFGLFCGIPFRPYGLFAFFKFAVLPLTLVKLRLSLA